MSCGAKKGATQFMVTNSALTASNSSFTGGLVIMGKSAKSKFVVPIAYSTGTSSAVTLDLDKDTWDFWAVGWSGTGLFEGIAKCDALIGVSISQDSQTVNLKLTDTNCANMTSFFGENAYYNAGTFKPFHLITCGVFYTDMTFTTEIQGTTSYNYCQTPTISEEFTLHAKAFKLEIAGVVGTTPTTSLSECFPLTSGFNLTSKNLPVRGLPVRITLYNDTVCSDSTKAIARYLFASGISNGSTEFDSVVGNEPGYTKLFLPGKTTRRAFGINSFASLLPQIDFSGSAIMPLPSASSLIVSSNSEFVLAENLTSPDCSTVSLSNVTNITGLTFDNTKNCRIDDDRIYISLNYSSISTLGSFDESVNASTLSVANSPYHELFDRGFETFGWPATGPDTLTDLSFSTFFDQHDDEEKERSSGAMRNARDIFLPGGPLSLFGKISCAPGVNPVRDVQLFDDGEVKIFRGKLSDISETAPSYICNPSDPRGATCTQNFNKRFHVSRLRSGTTSTYDTQIIMKFNCSAKVGMIEEQNLQSERTEKTLTYWNTSSPNTARMEVYNLDIEKDSSSVVNQKKNSYLRIEKTNSGTVVANLLNFHARNNSSLWSSWVNHEQLHAGVSSAINYLKKSIQANPGTNPDELFQPVYKSLLKVSSPGNRYATAESPNKRFEVRAILTGICSSRNIDVFIKDRSSSALAVHQSYSVTCSGSEDVTRPEISVNDSGKAIVGVVSPDSTLTNRVDAFTFDGTNWNQNINPGQLTFTSSNPVIRVKVFSNGTGVLLWLQHGSSNPDGIYELHGTDFTSFNAGTGLRNVVLYNTTFAVPRFDIAVDSSERIWIFGAYELANGTHALLYDNSMVYLAGQSGAGILYNPEEIRSDAEGTSVKFFLKYNDTTDNRIQEYSLTEATGVISIATSPAVITKENIFVDTQCASQTATSFTSPGSGCSFYPGSYVRPVKSQIDLTPASLAPSNFEAIFTSSFTTLP
jgi:hypothetical protein